MRETPTLIADAVNRIPTIFTSLLLLTLLALARPAGAQQSPYSVNTYSVSGHANLNVLTPSGNIEVISERNRSQVRVELYVDRGISVWSRGTNLDNYRITNQQRNGEIVATVEPKGSFMGERVTFSYRIYVPPHVSTRLQTTTGDISLRDVKGEQNLLTSSGDITVSGSSGTVWGKTSRGDIRLENFDGEIRLRVLSGEIDAEKMKGVMIADIVNGDIRAQYEKVSKGMRLETVRGDIWLRLPRQAFDFEINGSRVNFKASGEFDGIRRANRVEGTYREGGGPRILLRSTSGTVTVETR